jgi:hypothetical protein
VGEVWTRYDGTCVCSFGRRSRLVVLGCVFIVTEQRGSEADTFIRLGFQQLNPKFGIRSSGNDTTRLPSASSCFNLLKLPEYKVSSSFDIH